MAVNGSMTLMIDPEPTVSAQVEDETQSLHAWSQEDTATELVDYRPRSWKIPATIAALAAGAAITAGLFMAWPSATKQQVAPTKSQVAAPAKPAIPSTPSIQSQNPDDRYVALIQQRGMDVISRTQTINAAHWICEQHKNGYPASQIAQAIIDATPGMTMKGAAIDIDTALEVYCPN
jgi:hypothetical protein